MGIQPLHCFREIDDAAAFMARVGDLELTQRTPGKLELSLLTGTIGQSLIYDSITNRALLSVGSRSPDYVTFSPMTATTVQGKFRGHTPRIGQVLVMDPGGDSFQIISESQRQVGLSVPLEIFSRIAVAEFGCDQPSKLWKWNLIESERDKSSAFTEMLSRLLSNDQAFWCRPHLEIELAECAVGFACTESVSQQYSMVSFDKQRIVREALEMMTTRLSDPPSVLELCEYTGATRRMLFYAFQQLLQTSPSQYSKSYRCHTARKMLLQKDCLGVQFVASQLGFTHFGQFAIDYARIFGESPSQTLAQK